MGKGWGRGDLVQLLFIQKSKHEPNTEGRRHQQVGKMGERQGIGNEGNGVKRCIADRWHEMGTQQEQRCRRILQIITRTSR